MNNTINQSRITNRGIALMKVYSKNRKVVPALDVFINDYFKIVDPGKSNHHLMKQTTLILKDVYDNFIKQKKTKIAVTIVL
ncbi:MAG: hypothetical protein ABJK28_09335 [Algibacter sp.]